MTSTLAGSLIRRARVQKGLSQESLAALAGTTQSAISRIENGASIPSFDRVLELLDCLGLTIALNLQSCR